MRKDYKEKVEANRKANVTKDKEKIDKMRKK